MARYTKAQLEKIVYTQHENLEAMHDLLQLMKLQTDLIKSVNEKVTKDMTGIKIHLQSIQLRCKERRISPFHQQTLQG